MGFLMDAETGNYQHAGASLTLVSVAHPYVENALW